MTDNEIKEKLIGFFCYDTQGPDGGIHDEELRYNITKLINEKEKIDKSYTNKLIASLLYEHFLDEESITLGYGIEDAREFLNWFEQFESDYYND